MENTLSSLPSPILSYVPTPITDYELVVSEPSIIPPPVVVNEIGSLMYASAPEPEPE